MGKFAQKATEFAVKAIFGGLLAACVAVGSEDCNIPQWFRDVPLEGRVYLPPEHRKKKLADYDIPTRGQVNLISLLEDEKYTITEKGDGEVAVEGLVHYCIGRRPLDYSEHDPYMDCDERYSKITLE
jgi:hypothetical protein